MQRQWLITEVNTRPCFEDHMYGIYDPVLYIKTIKNVSVKLAITLFDK